MRVSVVCVSRLVCIFAITVGFGQIKFNKHDRALLNKIMGGVGAFLRQCLFWDFDIPVISRRCISYKIQLCIM